MKLEKIIDQYYEKLNDNELYIWNYILHHKAECQNITIQNLAMRCNVSHTTILRFVKKLGFKGYSEFKVYLRWDTEQEGRFGPNEIETSYFEFIKNLNHIKDEDCKELFQYLESANRVFAYGTGEVQKNAAKELKRCFSATNQLIYLLEGTDETEIIIKSVKENDVFFIISLSGENSVAVNLTKRLKERNVKVVAITEDNNNTLSKLSDVHLSFSTHRVKTRQDYFNVYLVTHLFVMVEMLFLKYLEYLG